MERSRRSGGYWYSGMAGGKSRGNTKVKTVFSTIGIIALVVVTAFCIKALNNRIVPIEQAPNTYNNLLVAMSGEVNSYQKYMDFAEQARSENEESAERLFLAMADAEKIHLGNNHKMVSEMRPAQIPQAVKKDVGSTKENVAACIATETKVSDNTYPRFIEDAEKEGYSRAERIFQNAYEAEKSHLVLLEEIKQSMEAGEAYGAKLFLCPNCGYVEKNSRPVLCRSCGTFGLEFKEY